ncbi:MAG TPA: cupin domain-containing protein [Bryobacteraceae bacterium]|jgi:mannose-6-phosphate isomerase-like protein (cupin superfamily)|nr:cupin domain-containing protein [Bryobacteraceae bacterium]
MIVSSIAAQATFSQDKMSKQTLAKGDHLFAGLNCFLPGQEHKAHTHEGQDKMYVILEGSGEAMVGETKAPVSAGDLVLAPSGVLHSLRNTSEVNLVVLVVFAPPPAK